MPGLRRTPEQREVDLQRVSEMYLKGMPHWEMAQVIGISRQQISTDLNSIRKKWLESSIINFDERRAVQVARVDQLEKTYWETWEASTWVRDDDGNYVKDAEGKVKQDLTQGDLKALAGVERCIERRCKILGVDAPTKVAPVTPDGNDEYGAGFTEQERGRLYVALVARLGLADCGPAPLGAPPANGQALDRLGLHPGQGGDDAGPVAESSHRVNGLPSPAPMFETGGEDDDNRGSGDQDSDP